MTLFLVETCSLKLRDKNSESWSGQVQRLGKKPYEAEAELSFEADMPVCLYLEIHQEVGVPGPAPGESCLIGC